MSEQLIATPGVFGENGNFLLERELGAGGMGGVYMGRDKMLDRPVAVKVMLKEYGADAEFVEKFKKEAQAAAKLIHPNIAQIYSYGICDGMPYIAMELVAGGSLDSLMKHAEGGKTDVPRVMKICQQVAQALQCASDQGYVHGDVKPENILLDANGNAKLVDFGLAGMQKDTSEIWGTPYYISPEKVKQEVVDYRADMYSLGGTLFHALTGKPPFDGEDVSAVVKARFTDLPPKPSSIRPELSPQIDALVMKMLAFKKEDRFPSFEALLEEFKKVMTTGLDSTSRIDNPAEAGAKKPGGTRKMTMHGRRTMTVRRSGAVLRKPLNAAEDGGSESSAGAEESKSGAKDAEEEEEGGGNLGVKVAGVVVGVIALVGAVIGGLIWYQVSSKNAQEAERQASIVKGIRTARQAIEDTAGAAAKFADEVDALAETAERRCRESSDNLSRLLPDFADLMKPAPTKELLDAIASTNETAAAAPAPVTAPVSTNAAPAEAAAPVATNAAPAEAAAEAPANTEKPREIPPVVNDIAALWERACSCRASAIRVRHGMRKVVAMCATAADVKGEDLESANTDPRDKEHAGSSARKRGVPVRKERRGRDGAYRRAGRIFNGSRADLGYADTEGREFLRIHRAGRLYGGRQDRTDLFLPQLFRRTGDRRIRRAEQGGQKDRESERRTLRRNKDQPAVSHDSSGADACLFEAASRAFHEGRGGAWNRA